jgi:chorismate synthase
MSGNTFGNVFKLTTFGESHGKAIGGIIDGCPAGLFIDIKFIQVELGRRRPGQSGITTERKEPDEIEILSGIDINSCSTGAPIGFTIRNKDQRPGDYKQMNEAFRPSHADYTWHEKYGISPQSGGGRASARETACRVAGGAIAKLLLQKHNLKITAFVSSVGTISVPEQFPADLSFAEKNIVRCPDENTANKMIEMINRLKAEGDSIGGVINCLISGVPAGLGEPVFDKLHADLGKAMLSINAVKGFEYGSGFKAAEMKGSDHNDGFYKEGEAIRTKTNFSGGIQGGISNGEDIYFRVAFKPVSTIKKEQGTISLKGENVIMKNLGRHDPCVVPRAVPIVEAMAALVLADFYLRSKISKV